jgi:hypothetical protein
MQSNQVMASLVHHSKEMLKALEEQVQVAESSMQRPTPHANLFLLEGTIWYPSLASQCLYRPNVQTSFFILWCVP